MIAVVAIVAGVFVAAALDHRLGWGTLMSVALAVYCHRLYREPTSSTPPNEAPESAQRLAAPDDDELRPGWAARWGREPSATQRCAPVCREESSGSGQVQVMGGAPVVADAPPWPVTREEPK